MDQLRGVRSRGGVEGHSQDLQDQGVPHGSHGVGQVDLESNGWVTQTYDHSDLLDDSPQGRRSQGGRRVTQSQDELILVEEDQMVHKDQNLEGTCGEGVEGSLLASHPGVGQRKGLVAHMDGEGRAFPYGDGSHDQ